MHIAAVLHVYMCMCMCVRMCGYFILVYLFLSNIKNSLGPISNPKWFVCGKILFISAGSDIILCMLVNLISNTLTHTQTHIYIALTHAPMYIYIRIHLCVYDIFIYFLANNYTWFGCCWCWRCIWVCLIFLQIRSGNAW